MIVGGNNPDATNNTVEYTGADVAQVKNGNNKLIWQN